MFTNFAQNQQISKDMVGMVRYCSYWRKYTLIVDVSESGEVTELDSFGPVNDGAKHTIRKHRTALGYKDVVMSVSDFYKVCEKDRNPVTVPEPSSNEKYGQAWLDSEAKLTLKDFASDYQHLVVGKASKDSVNEHIAKHYSHIKTECEAFVQRRIEP